MRQKMFFIVGGLLLCSLLTLGLFSFQGKSTVKPASKQFVESVQLAPVLLPVKSEKDSVERKSTAQLQADYVLLKKRIQYQRRQPVSVDSCLSYLFTCLVDSIFPYWYGTPWDYNGYSEVPQQGEIACGYFVSTTLRDLGFRLNRFDLAKLYSRAIVETLCMHDTTFYLMTDLLTHIKKQPDEVYVVGLDNHVGFLVKRDTTISFIHSNYLDEGVVMREKAAESEALQSSRNYVLGGLIHDPKLIKFWKSNARIYVAKK